MAEVNNRWAQKLQSEVQDKPQQAAAAEPAVSSSSSSDPQPVARESAPAADGEHVVVPYDVSVRQLSGLLGVSAQQLEGFLASLGEAVKSEQDR